MNLQLQAEDSQVLREVLESYLSELSTEISHTDSADFRDGLKHKKEVLQRILAALGGAPG